MRSAWPSLIEIENHKLKLTWEGILWDQHSRESSGKSRTPQLLLGSPAFSPGHSYLFSLFCMWPRCVKEAKPAISRSLLQVHFQWSNFRRSRSHFQPEKENISNQKSIFNLMKYFQSKKFPTRKTISFFIFYNMFILHWFLSKYFFPLILHWKKRKLTHFSSWNWSGHLNSGRLGVQLLTKKNYLQK